MREMFHLNLTNYPFLPPLTSLVGLDGQIYAQRAHHIASAYSLAFFDKELKGKPVSLLDGPAKQYPEVLFETRLSGSTASICMSTRISLIAKDHKVQMINR